MAKSAFKVSSFDKGGSRQSSTPKKKTFKESSRQAKATGSPCVENFLEWLFPSSKRLPYLLVRVYKQQFQGELFFLHAWNHEFPWQVAAHNPLRKFFASRAWPTNLTLQAKSSIYWTEWGAARRQKRGVSSGHRFTGESSPSYREKTSQRAPKKMNENAIRESPHKLTSDTSSHWVVLFQSISPNIWLECDPFSWWKGMYTFEGTNISHHGKRKIIFKSAMVGDMLVPRMVIPQTVW